VVKDKTQPSKGPVGEKKLRNYCQRQGQESLKQGNEKKHVQTGGVAFEEPPLRKRTGTAHLNLQGKKGHDKGSPGKQGVKRRARELMQ